MSRSTYWSPASMKDLTGSQPNEPLPLLVPPTYKTCSKPGSRLWAAGHGNVVRQKKCRPEGRHFLLRKTDYFEAAGAAAAGADAAGAEAAGAEAAAEAAWEAAEAAWDAAEAASEAAEAAEAAAEAAASGADAAGADAAGAAAGAGAASSFLLQAARATASRAAIRRDFFIVLSFKDYRDFAMNNYR